MELFLILSFAFGLILLIQMIRPLILLAIFSVCVAFYFPTLSEERQQAIKDQISHYHERFKKAWLVFKQSK